MRILCRALITTGEGQGRLTDISGGSFDEDYHEACCEGDEAPCDLYQMQRPAIMAGPFDATRCNAYS